MGILYGPAGEDGTRTPIPALNASADQVIVPNSNGQSVTEALAGKAAASHTHTLDNLDGTLSISKGGTGATTAEGARTAINAEVAGLISQQLKVDTLDDVCAALDTVLAAMPLYSVEHVYVSINGVGWHTVLNKTNDNYSTAYMTSYANLDGIRERYNVKLSGSWAGWSSQMPHAHSIGQIDMPNNTLTLPGNLSVPLTTSTTALSINGSSVYNLFPSLGLGRTAIPQGTNINSATYCNVGCYRVVSDGIAASITGLPADYAGVLDVSLGYGSGTLEWGSSSTWIMRKYTTYLGTVYIQRVGKGSAGNPVFYSWYQADSVGVRNFTKSATLTTGVFEFFNEMAAAGITDGIIAQIPWLGVTSSTYKFTYSLCVSGTGIVYFNASVNQTYQVYLTVITDRRLAE